MRVVVVEDNEFDARLIKHDLERVSTGMQIEIATTYRSGLQAVCSGTYDAGVVDYRLGSGTGVALIEESRLSGVQIPLILLTGQGGINVDVQAMRRGASDYLNKDEMTGALLERTIRYAIEREVTSGQLVASYRRYEAAVLGSNDGIWDWDPRSDTLYLSPRFKSMVGLDDAQMPSSRAAWFSRAHDQDRARLEAALATHLRGGSETLAVEYRLRHRDGSWVWVYLRGLAQRDAAGNVERLAGSQSDISARKFAENAALHQSLHDSLTGLANRVLLFDRLEQMLKRARRESGYDFSILYLDLDGFKPINDEHGHAVGDLVLMEVAARISSELRDVDCVARVGGDEFVVLLDRCQRGMDADRVARKLEEAIAAPIACPDGEVSVGASVGVHVAVDVHTSPKELLDRADRAMYVAKVRRRRGDPIRLLPGGAGDDPSLAVELRRALSAGTVVPHFQPIVDARSGAVVGYEALARWTDDIRGPVSPVQFVPVAEREGLVIELGRVMLAQACSWAATNGDRFSISVNISAQHLASPRFVEDVDVALSSSGLAPTRLRVEITEHAQLTLDDATAAGLRMLSSRGICIDVDDFGTGYSSSELLLQVPVSAIKLDRSIVGGLHADPRKAALVRSLVTLAHSLGATVTAEGIESKAEWAAAREARIDLAQGFFFGRPCAAPRIPV